MKDKTKDTIATIIVFGIIFLFIGGAIFFFINSIYQDEKADKYCSKIYPSHVNDKPNIKEVWAGGDYRVEEGYTKCCRLFSEDHELKEECKIFPEID